MSDEEEDKGMKDVKHPYINLLMNKISMIYDAWDGDDVELSLRRACRLVYFLPVALKDQLRGDVDVITESLNRAYGISTGVFYTSQVVQTREARQTAQRYLRPLVDKIMTLLDERGYLEIKRRKVPEGGET